MAGILDGIEMINVSYGKPNKGIFCWPIYHRKLPNFSKNNKLWEGTSTNFLSKWPEHPEGSCKQASAFQLDERKNEGAFLD